MNNYKGIFYNETNEKNYYEGGAHFKYKDLYEVLLFLSRTSPMSEKENNIDSTKSNNNEILNINRSLNLNKRKSYSKTRNIQNNILPNTQLIFSINSNPGKNNELMGSNGFSKSRNYQEGFSVNEKYRYNKKTNTIIFNYNQKKNFRDNLINTIVNKKSNNINNEEKTNNINIYDYINSNSHKSLMSNRNKNNSRQSVQKSNLNQKYCYNFKYSDLINNNTNRFYIKKNKSKINQKKQFNYFKEKMNILFPRKDYDNYSRNIINPNKNMINYLKSLELNKGMIFKEKNINNCFIHPENKKLNFLKNCSSGINVNNYINKSISRNKYLNGNNLSLRNNINIGGEKHLKDSKKNSQKIINKKINDFFNLNQRITESTGKKKFLSRNINSINNNYISQYFKYKTSEINDFKQLNS